jgi:indolepyruvate ferredoxin oxidoreductase
MGGLLKIQRRGPAAAAPGFEGPYEKDSGSTFMTGVQALVRSLFDQHRADAAAGLRTATLVSGYQGSPLGGFDREVAKQRERNAQDDLVLRPAVNEELGATAVWGSQIAASLPGAKYDGVVGVWYGKAPGVDRAADAIRHGNFVGTDPRGGVLALCGDDPASKSSTVPNASESLLAALQVPVLVASSVQDALDLARHGIACSRASGLWTALKVVTNVADAAATVEVGIDRVQPWMPVLEWEGKPYVHRPSSHLLAPQSLEMERTMKTVRLDLAREYGRLNGLNRIAHDPPGARLGVVASGAVAEDARRALADLGFADGGPARLIQLGMVYPLDEAFLREATAGLDEVLVLEEKGPFLERLVKEALYGSGAAPPVTGHRDDRGAPLVDGYRILDADAIARVVGARLLAHEDIERVRTRLGELEEVGARTVVESGARRVPFFCSGCPHNSSTVVDDDQIVGAGIGCSTMVMMAEHGRGDVHGITQMGGEGVQWVGVAPFIEDRHFVQNLGDGTFHHSGSLAIRAAVAADLDVTYKILFNGNVAMTGGQQIEGGMSIVDSVRSLLAEGVRKVVITTDETSKYRKVNLPQGVEVHRRDDVQKVQRQLAEAGGVTVLIHDQGCALGLRRARKRGLAPERPQRVVINERVCEGCGDCGEKSSCLSVEPVDTEFGRKTQINQTTCNKDFSCLEGDCPSFLTVLAPEGASAEGEPRLPEIDLPEPRLPLDRDEVRVRMVGIGGTGVVTVSHVLGTASMLDGRHSSGLDQTGLSQKAGPVVSDVRLTGRPVEDGVTVPSATADVILGLDLVSTATADKLRVASADRTVAIVSNSVVPTAAMIVDVDATAPDLAEAQAAIDSYTRASDNVYLDAQRICKEILGDTTMANVVVLGAAWQAGVLPLSLGSVRQAFRLNGVAVEKNLAAFAWGRAWVVAPEAVRTALADDAAEPAELSDEEAALIDLAAPADGELRRLASVRIPDLIGWGGAKPARCYAETLARVRGVEDERIPGSTDFSAAVARGLHKLMAYKDEYEVARLHLDGLASLPDGAKVTFHLHPPVLRAMGMRRKLRLGSWFVPFFRLLRQMRRLRGTAFDPFGRAAVRKVERQLPGEYLRLVDGVLASLSPDSLDVALEIASLPDLVRGYEEIKLAGVARFRERATELSGASQ